MERTRYDEQGWPDDSSPDDTGDEWEEDEPDDDPNDPEHPDYDLSEAAGYGARDYGEDQAFPSQTMVAVGSLILLAALAAPLLIRFLR